MPATLHLQGRAMIYILATAAGRRELEKLIDRHGSASPPRIVPRNYADVATLDAVEGATVLFADLERLPPAHLEQVASIWNNLSRSGRGLRLQNHPARVMRRYELLRELNERGVNDFDVYRLTEGRAPRRYPVFLQAEGRSAAEDVELLWSLAELEAAVDRLAAEGRTRIPRLVVEFAGEVDERGFYRRFSAYCLAGRVVPGQLAFSRHWRVRATGAPVEDWMLVEERAYLESNAHGDLIRSVFRLARIDVGRVDFSLVGGRAQVYGIDTTPNFCSASDERQAAHFPGRLAIGDRLIEALGELSARLAEARERPVAAGEDGRSAPP